MSRFVPYTFLRLPRASGVATALMGLRGARVGLRDTMYIEPRRRHHLGLGAATLIDQQTGHHTYMSPLAKVWVRHGPRDFQWRRGLKMYAFIGVVCCLKSKQYFWGICVQ